jgi:hypothetical protein
MSESSYLAGVAGSIPWNGREMRIAIRDIDMEGLFCTWAKEEALRNILRLEVARPGGSGFPPVVIDRMLKHWTDTAAFTFSWGSDGCEQARYSDAGVRYMAWLQMVKMDGAVTRSMVDDLAKDRKMYNVLVRYVVGDLDPNQLPPQPAGPQQP